MNTLMSLALLLTALSVVVKGNSPSKRQLTSSGQMELVRRRGGLNQPVRMVPRGRKKSIWSYNPGHRSLAFLVAGEVDVVSPPPIEPGTGEYRCLGCCGDKATNQGKVTTAQKISNRVNRILHPSERLGDLGTEPNSINDRCLGCCEESVTPSLRVTPEKRAKTGSQKEATAGETRPRQTQQQKSYQPPCTPPKCNPNWRYEASSSSEEEGVVRRQRPQTRLQRVHLRSGSRCRHLGCRSALGAVQDSSSSSSSSSSEED